MHELHPGVQDMACDTFLKIAQKCKRKFVTQQPAEPRPFVQDLVAQLPQIISDLEPPSSARVLRGDGDVTVIGAAIQCRAAAARVVATLDDAAERRLGSGHGGRGARPFGHSQDRRP